MGLSEQEIADLKAEHGQNLHLEVFEDPEDPEGDGVEIVLKPPTNAAFRRFVDERNEGKIAASTVIQNFVDPHVVYPAKDGFKQIAEKLSGVRVTLSVKLQQLAGAMGSRSSKKL